MNPWTADPTRTHALLVGVEKYEAGGDWNLNGPVRDVLAFHTWLCSRGVPAKQIRALVSPLDENVALLDQSKLNITSATSTEVRRALNALHEENGDLLFLFWAGHGVLYEEQHRLFLADATINDKHNLDLDALRKSMHSDYFAGFPRQIIIVDACANYQNFGFTLPIEELPCGGPLQHEQFIFFAARPGQVTKNLGEEKRGLFSRELLKQIKGLPESSWPPDMRGLAEMVQGEFAALRASGEADQTPVYAWNRDWEGNFVELRMSALPTDKAQALKESWKLTSPQLMGMTDALMRCKKMNSSDGRNDVMAQIRTEISAAVERRSDTKSDVLNIVQTASNYAGGLEELLWTIHYYEGESASWQKVQRVVTEGFQNFRISSDESPGASS